MNLTDEQREALAEMLWRADFHVHGIENGTAEQFEADNDRMTYRLQADALAPVVARWLAEARREALREAADEIGPNGGADRWLRDRADVLAAGDGDEEGV